MCCAGDCVCVCSCWLARTSIVEKQLFSRDVASGESWLGALASHRGTKDLSARGQTGHPLPGLASVQLPDLKLSARMVAWRLWVAPPSPELLFSPLLFHLLLTPVCLSLALPLFYPLIFSPRTTPSVCPMGNVLLDLFPLWLMIFHRHKKGQEVRLCIMFA